MAPIPNMPVVDFWTSDTLSGDERIWDLWKRFSKDWVFEVAETAVDVSRPRSVAKPKPEQCVLVSLGQAKYSTNPERYLGQREVQTADKLSSDSRFDAVRSVTEEIASIPTCRLVLIVVAWRQVSDKVRQQMEEEVKLIAGNAVETIVCEAKDLREMYGPTLLQLGWFMEDVSFSKHARDD